MNIKNTNITLKEGAYILEYCPSGNSYGERITIITYNVKETAKKYKKAGFYLFGCPLLYSENVFFKLTKSFKISTQNHKKITIGNALYHIQKAADNFKIQTD
jgi:hypothetical protein